MLSDDQLEIESFNGYDHFGEKDESVGDDHFRGAHGVEVVCSSNGMFGSLSGSMMQM